MIGRTAVLTETAAITVGHGPPAMGAFVARPAGPWPRGGVLVAGELFGLSAHVRDVSSASRGLATSRSRPTSTTAPRPGLSSPTTPPDASAASLYSSR